MNHLLENVILWAEGKGIYEKSTANAQLLGAIGELMEYREARVKDEPVVEQAMELGDVIVFLINYAVMYDNPMQLDELNDLLDDKIEMPMDNDGHDEEMLAALENLAEGNTTAFIYYYLTFFIQDLGYRPHECLRLAYNKINKRSGEMRNGKFVKSEDLEP